MNFLNFLGITLIRSFFVLLLSSIVMLFVTVFFLDEVKAMLEFMVSLFS